jgi:hypothetical protein
MAKHSEPEMVYVYGIVADTFDVAGAPPGLDDAPVRVIAGSGFAALASSVEPGSYAPSAIERQSADVAWLSPRAQAHDRVLTWAQERDVVLPLPIFSLWASSDSVSRSLAGQRDRIATLMRRVSGTDEYGLRVHRRDDDVLKSLESIDPEAARLRAQAQGAPPGQRYLLERKLAEYGKTAVKTAAHQMATTVYEKLRSLSREALARSLVPDSARVEDATMILNGAFLVERAHLNEFRSAVGALMGEYSARGLAFDFTGPWPPYNFVADGGAPALDARGERA